MINLVAGGGGIEDWRTPGLGGGTIASRWGQFTKWIQQLFRTRSEDLRSPQACAWTTGLKPIYSSTIIPEA